MPFFENRSLFSDHYLAARLPERPEWRADASAAFAEARALYAARRAELERMNEAQTEEEWVKPLLTRVLGWSYSVQTDATHFGRRNRPDYALFTGEAERALARAAPDGRLDYAHAAAVGDAKFWGRPLDRELRDERDRLTNTNPSFQIVNYLVATGVEWLTAWWEQDFPAFRAQVKRTLGTEIPLAERDDWEAYLAAQRAEHDRLTAEIVRHETDLNQRVYALYGLTGDEIAIIEEQTAYAYGEV
jgi:hypothetical protein